MSGHKPVYFVKQIVSGVKVDYNLNLKPHKASKQCKIHSLRREPATILYFIQGLHTVYQVFVFIALITPAKPAASL